MKNTAVLLTSLLLFTFQVNGETFKSPDILLDSKLDNNWSGLMVNKIRLLMKNYGAKDPFKGSINQNIVVSESRLGKLLPPDSLPLINDLGNVIGLNIHNAQSRVYMDGLNYEVKDFRTDLKGLEELSDGLVLATDFSASELRLSTEKLTFTLMIPGKNKNDLPVIQIDIIRPSITAREESLVNFFTKVKIQDKQDHYKLEMRQAEFSRMATELVARPELVELNYEGIVVPEISLKVGGKVVSFSSHKVEKLLRSKHEAIKSILLAELANTLEKDTALAFLKVFEKHKIPKEYWLDSDLIKSKMEISKFSTSVAHNHVEVKIPGDFCTAKGFTLLKKECLLNKVTKIADSRLNQKLHQQSLGNLKYLMENGDANIVASISEDYLNKLLVTTYDAGLWKQALDGAGVDLGPNKVVLRMDKNGDSATLIMDVVYRANRLERLALGSKVVRFPLVMDISLRVEKHDSGPVAIVRLNDADLSDETLINGKPELNIISNIKDVPRLKGTILKTIRNNLSKLKNKDIVDVKYPEFKGIGLEQMDFISDGNGRMNAMMRLEDLLKEQQL